MTKDQVPKTDMDNIKTKKGEEEVARNGYEQHFCLIRVIRAIRGSFFSSFPGGRGA